MHRLFRSAVALLLALAASPVFATGSASGLATMAERGVLNGFFAGYSATATSGGSPTSIVLSSSVSSSFQVGDWVKCAACAPANAVSQVVAIPDGTHLTISPAVTTMATSGAITIVGWSPASVWIGLLNTCPSDAAGTGAVEVSTSGTGYARTAAPPGAANWSAPSGTPSAVSNASQITIGSTASASWGTVACVGFFDAGSSGNMWAWGTLTTPKTINNGDPAPYFPATTGLSVTAD